MNRRIIVALVGSLFLVAFFLTLALLVVMPESIWFRGVLALLAVLTLALVASILLSIQRFFSERRKISNRILQEIRVHRAETRLGRSELNEVTEMVRSLLSSQAKQSQGVKELAPHKEPVLASRSLVRRPKAGQIVSSDKSSLQFESELRQIILRLGAIEADNERALKETLEHSNVRSKQLVSILEAQRVELESLKRGFPTANPGQSQQL